MAYPFLSQSLPSVGRGAVLDLSNEVDELLDDDELANQEIGYTSRDNILFCIDGSLAMQTPLPDATSLGVKTDEDDTDAEGRSLNTTGKGKSPLHIALESVLGVMRGKILSGPSDFIGVLIYNIYRYGGEESRTESTGTGLDTQQHGMTLYLPLRQIGADEIKGLNQFVEDANASLAVQDSSEKGREQPDTISQTFPPAQPGDEIDIADALEGCLHAFRDAGAKLPGNKRIFLVTNNDRPDRPQGAATSSGSARMDTRGPARTRYMDLLSLGVIVDPFFISSSEEPFDNEYYWNDILNRAPEDHNSDDNDPSVLPTVTIDSGDGLAKLQEIMLEQVFRTSSKRVLFNVPLKFGGKDGDIMISVNGYSVITSMKKPTTKLYDLSGRQPIEARTRTLYTSTATGDRLDTNEIGFAYNFGKSDSATTLMSAPWQQRMKDYYEEHGAPKEDNEGDETEPEEEEEEEEASIGVKQATNKATIEHKVQTRVALTAKDIREYKSLGLDPQIKIIGFMDPKNVRFELNVKNSIFLYPDEKTFTGSTRTFAALLASCLSRNKCALAFAFTRRTSTPYYAALMPQAEAQLEGGGQASPPGFHMIPLPFADDLRARPEKVPKAMQLCTSEQVDAMSAVLKKLRLKQSTYEPRAYPNPGLNYFFGQLQALAFEEEFKPEKMYDKTKPLLDGMHQHGGTAMREFNETLAADERAAPPPARTSAMKRGKADVDDLPVATDVYMEESWRSGLLTKMTVAQLKGYAQHVGVQPEGKALKGDWIRVISEHFEAASAEIKPSKKSRTK